MKRLIFFVLTIVVFQATEAQSLRSSRDTSLQLQADDPIAAALDSLAYLKLFEATRFGGEFGRPGNFGFSPDSVPKYSPEVIAERIKKLDNQSPFKLVYNKEVQAYISMYAERKREQVARMIGLSELYFPLFEEALARHKMPLELKYLAIVESALNPAARSRVGAQGLWQFMYSTAKLFKLNISSYVDERCDPRKSTEAACIYMKYLYSIYKDWSLVLAAYNSGPGNVNKAIRRSGGKTDYWQLRSYLPKETAGYVPAFIAAVYVMNHTREHNLYPIMPKAIFSEIDTVHINKKVTFKQLSQVLDMPEEDIAFLNPAYLHDMIPATDDHYVLTLPKEKVATFINNEETIYTYKSPQESRMDSLLSLQKDVPSKVKIHTVRSGESLSMIARKYGVTVNELKKWNKMKSSRLLRGQKLKVSSPEAVGRERIAELVPDEASEEAPQTETKTKEEPAKEQKDDYTIYKVKPGDSLWKISVNHGMTLDELRKLNGLSSRSVIKPGMKLKVKK
ncbi:MAG: LysM peptidoglycan-binding domain-containing protein [Bacteroidetes bacterium]|nr:LysM peptidoglycan-binding domain-containing protein [Bacteroidota bacterium]